MTEYTSIRVTVDAKENAEKSKRDGETWNDYLQRCTENPPEVREYVDADTAAGDSGPVTLEAGEYAKIADEVEGRMR
ncbi:putative antitoxin VapB3 [Halorubrum tailed virus 28]|uniref:Antitoxin VapB3 n=1 Tax=Halorubrum tailed virus 28 TaxID=2878009 RepID=A0AAE8Y1Y2_9CAUD|nr:putative antitoxin VapB3 [Halorubrum tailed virus 28]UBF23443.1 putative antitoxin VapB3 [Halorubrum tailed virus 28]